MKILFLLTQDLESPSGAGRYFPMGRHLQELGHQVIIVALHSNYRSLEQKKIQQGDLEIHYVGPMHIRREGNEKQYYSTPRLIAISFQATIRFFREAMKHQPDLLMVAKPHPMNSMAGLLASKILGIPVWLDCDDFEAELLTFGAKWQKMVIAFFERTMPLHADLVTTHTQFNMKRIMGYGVPVEKIHYLPNGVDTQAFEKVNPDLLMTLKQQLGIGHQPVVSYIGSLTRPAHAIQLLLPTFLAIAKQLPETHFLIVGGGEVFLDVQKEFTESPLADRVHMIGYVQYASIPAYYQLTNVLIDPLFDDDAARGRSPLKIFESWASGVPVVTGDVGDRRILFGEPLAGVLVPPGDADRLAQAAIDLLRSKAYAEQMRERGWNRVHEYAWSNLVRDLELALREHA